MTFPFDDPDFVGPEDRPQYVSPLEITMYGWRGQSTTGVKDFLDSIAPGGVSSSIRMAPKTEQPGVLVPPVGPEIPKVDKGALAPRPVRRRTRSRTTRSSAASSTCRTPRGSANSRAPAPA